MKCVEHRCRVIPMILSLAACSVGAPVVGAATPEQIDKIVENVSRYDFGQSRKVPAEIDRLINETHGKRALRARLETRILEHLEGEATWAAKQVFCRKLWTIGTEASVDVLARMLRDAKTTEMACYALVSHPSPRVNSVLRDAMGKTRGVSRVAVLNLLGDRRDREAAELIARHAKDADAAVADAAIGALGKIATEHAARTLTELRAGEPGRVRTAALYASLQSARGWATRGKSPAARVLYEELSGQGMPDPIRRGALAGRIRLAGSEGMPLILSIARGSVNGLKATAIAGLVTLPIDGDAALARARREIEAALPTLEPPLQVRVIEALAARGDRGFAPVVLAAIESDDKTVRLAVIEALALIGDAPSRALLAKIAATNTGREARRARAMLDRLNASSPKKTPPDPR